MLRRVLFNLHLYGALFLGVFVVILGVTGAIMAFEDDLDRLLNPGLFRVQVGEKYLPLEDLLSSVRTAFPEQRFNGLRFPAAPNEAFVAQALRTQIFIDGYTGKVVGTRTGPTVLQQIHTIHLRLLMGKTGEKIVIAAAVVLGFLTLSGIYLWWPLKRIGVKFNASLRRISFDLHHAVGAYSFLFLLVLTATGIFVGFDDELSPVLHEMTNSKPPVRNVPSIPQAGVTRISPEKAIDSARAALPGAKPIAFTLPAGAKGSYFVPMRYPEDLTPGGRSWVVVEQYTGAALFVESSRTAPGGTKIIIVNRAIHTGDIGGYWTKVVASLSSLMVVLQALTGYYMWWKRPRAANL